MTSDETKLLIEMSSDVRNITKTMTALSVKMERLQEEFVTQMTSRMAVAEEKINRLERIIYGLIALASAEAIAILFQYLQH